MNTIEIIYHGQSSSFTIPEKWEECSKRQFITACRFLEQSGEGSPEKLLQNISEIPRNLLKRITHSEIQVLCASLNWIGSAPMFANSHFPKLGLFVGPRAGLTNITFEQLGLADQEFNKWVNKLKKGEKDLDKEMASLAGVLYRPRIFRFNKRLSDLWGWCMLRWHREKLLQLTYNYWGLRSWLTLRFKNTFSGGDGEDDGFGWPGLIVGVAGEKFGTPRQVARTSCYEVLIHLEQMAKHSESMK